MTSTKKSEVALQSVLTFDGIDDRFELLKGFPTIDQAITIEFWAKGENSLTQQTSILEACNAQNARVLNIHLPWQHVANSRIFWDAGNENGFNRIDKEVKIEEYNNWTHWAFVKSVSTGKMFIYRNGEIWHQGDGNKKSLAGINKFIIGSLVNKSCFWKGSLAELRIWNQARSQEEIKQNINLRLMGNEPGLVGYYPLNGDTNDRTSNGNNGTINGATWGKSELPVTGTKESETGKNPDEITGGNPPSKYGIADSRTNFYLVDTNKPINGNGELTGWNIWTENTSPVQLIIYRKEANAWSVVGKSEIKTPVVGLNEFSLTTAIKVNQGDFVGMYYPQAGSISFFKENNNPFALGNLSGKVLFTASGANATAFSDSSDRIYSLSVKSVTTSQEKEKSTSLKGSDAPSQNSEELEDSDELEEESKPIAKGKPSSRRGKRFRGRRKERLSVSVRKPLLLEFGRQKKDDVRDLFYGEGKLFKRIARIVEQQRAKGKFDDSVQPVIVVVKRKRHRKKSFWKKISNDWL